MAKKSYEVLVDELTVHRKVGDLIDPVSGQVLGIQQGQGETFYKGEVIPEDNVSPILIEALENEDHPSHDSVVLKIKATTGDASQNLAVRLGLPFEGYDEMDEDAVMAAIVNLPSPTISRIKEYEGANEGRERILNYSVGFGESPEDRQLGNVGSQLDEEARDSVEKATARLTTREVPEEGLVQQGEGVTGIGVPEKPYGEKKEGEDSGKGMAGARRGRRARPKAGGGGGAQEPSTTKSGDE